MPGTVLLIEDEESIATLVTAYLERDGFRRSGCARGRRGSRRSSARARAS